MSYLCKPLCIMVDRSPQRLALPLQRLAAEQEGHVRRMAAAYERWPGSHGRREEVAQAQPAQQQWRGDSGGGGAREGGVHPRTERGRPTSAPPRRAARAVARPPQHHEDVRQHDLQSRLGRCGMWRRNDGPLNEMVPNQLLDDPSLCGQNSCFKQGLLRLLYGAA